MIKSIYQNIKVFALIYILGFVLNLIWEFSHSFFYVHHQGGVITNYILIRAAAFDALFITLLAVPMFFVEYFRKNLWWAIIFGILFAIGLEWFALVTDRWAYTEAMPIIPFIKIGLTPTIQLGLTGWITYKLVYFYYFNNSWVKPR